MATSAVAGQPENAATAMTVIQEKLPKDSTAVQLSHSAVSDSLRPHGAVFINKSH